MTDALLLLAGAGPLTADPMLLASGGDSGIAIVLAPFVIGPVVFGLVYMGIYQRYRNADKRHAFEREVGVAVGNLRTGDHRTGSRRGLRTRTMSGANHHDHLTRVRRIQVR